MFKILHRNRDANAVNLNKLAKLFSFIKDFKLRNSKFKKAELADFYFVGYSYILIALEIFE